MIVVARLVPRWTDCSTCVFRRDARDQAGIDRDERDECGWAGGDGMTGGRGCCAWIMIDMYMYSYRL